MSTRNTFTRIGAVALAGSLLALGLAVQRALAATENRPSAFASTTIDIGVVVSDVEKAAAFYTKALGFTEVPGFDVSAEMGAGAGLTDNHPFHVRVLVLGDAPTATKLKIMEFPKVESKKADNRFIHSSLGFSYLTIFVTDAEAAIAQARKAGAVLVKDKPYPLKGAAKSLTLVRDPDGNVIELVEVGKP
ncbi:MAG: VOC family protein [Phycisphaerae bacterium]|nr:VOC family protein [Phycisphaerae bacterium]